MDAQTSCTGVNISQEMLEQNVNSNLTSTSEIECAEGYYLSNNGSICRPLCTLWTSPPGVSLDSDSLAVIVSMIIALLSSTALFILAFSIQRSTM